MVLALGGFFFVSSAFRKMKELCILQFTLDLGILSCFFTSLWSFFVSFEFSGETDLSIKAAK